MDSNDLGFSHLPKSPTQSCGAPPSFAHLKGGGICPKSHAAALVWRARNVFDDSSEIARQIRKLGGYWCKEAATHIRGQHSDMLLMAGLIEDQLRDNRRLSEALKAIADGEGDAQDIARQTLQGEDEC